MIKGLINNMEVMEKPHAVFDILFLRVRTLSMWQWTLDEIRWLSHDNSPRPKWARRKVDRLDNCCVWLDETK